MTQAPEQWDASSQVPSDWLTEAEVAALTKFERGTLRNMRYQGRGPRFCKIGPSVRYRMEDVQAWMRGEASAR